MNDNVNRTPRKKRRWLRVTIVLSAVFIIGLITYGYSVFRSVQQAVNTMHEPIDRTTSDRRIDTVTLNKKEPFSVLMLGVDERAGDKGRTDTMVVLAVNPNNDSVKMVSIPRDTRVKIVGWSGGENKINHAFAYGDVGMSVATVEHFLDIPIDYYMKINMEGFREIVDAVGGVDVQNDIDFTFEGAHFPKGPIHLNGKKALQYSRMRDKDPRGDFGRQIRQRQIIQSVVKKGAHFKTVTNYRPILNSLGKNVKTNLTFNEIVDIQKNYKDASKHIEQLQIAGSGKKINKIYYYVVPDEEKKRVQKEMKEQMELI